MEAAPSPAPHSPNPLPRPLHDQLASVVAEWRPLAKAALHLRARRLAAGIVESGNVFPASVIGRMGQVDACQKQLEDFALFAARVYSEVGGPLDDADWEWIVWGWAAPVTASQAAGYVHDDRQARAKRKAADEAFAKKLQADLAASLNRDPREPGTARLIADLGGVEGGAA